MSAWITFNMLAWNMILLIQTVNLFRQAKTWNPRLHAWQLKCTIFEDLDFWVICPRCDRHRLAHFPSFPTPPHHNRRKIIRVSNLFLENTILIYPLPNSRRPLHIKTGRKLSKSPELILPLPSQNILTNWDKQSAHTQNIALSFHRSWSRKISFKLSLLMLYELL